uniref:Alpha-fibrinogenase-like n=1 Tax=Daboia siamensis TaxID=343250 RepID=VSPAF_DABSI|nr:RecName: Full=Alpha-fibrinogenase-like; Short=RVAF; AltName: Full=Snake venom serine protease; Short=SVSP; Flags: Precursor [Daboia siamensis]ADP88559.1 serine alpha-fibrinogenase-like protein precursor [Daboia siamensis]
MVLIRVLANLLVLQLSYAQKSSELVVGGHPCNIYEHHFLAFMYNSSGFMCSGTLINQQWVLSAAHCDMENMHIYLGLHSFKLPNKDQKKRVAKEKFFCLSSKSYTKWDKDIMLIKLNKPVTYSTHIASLSLPSNPPRVGSVCRIMGWGSITSPKKILPFVPHCANINIVPYTVCRVIYRPLPEQSRTLCAGVSGRRIGSCLGDSGGPLICNGQIQGIVSWGSDPCVNRGAPSIYTKVFDYTDWIHSIIAGNTAATCPS